MRKARAAFAKKFPTESTPDSDSLSADEKRKRADAHKEAGNALLGAKECATLSACCSLTC